MKKKYRRPVLVLLPLLPPAAVLLPGGQSLRAIRLTLDALVPHLAELPTPRTQERARALGELTEGGRLDTPSRAARRTDCSARPAPPEPFTLWSC